MEVHALDRGLNLLRRIGVPTQSVDYQFPHDAQAETDVESYLGEAGISRETPLVVVHPVARWRTKLWLNERFAALADALQEQGIAVVFSGSDADTAALDEIAGLMKQPCRRFTGCGGLRHLAALCRRACAVVSTDTGPMHLAAAVGARVVALFGPTAPNRTGPYGAQHKVLQVQVDCGPCLKRQCASRVVEEFGCMKRIETARVLAAVLECVAEASQNPGRVVNQQGLPSNARA
jgi:ADP-heptose:LPS heptosyltransferase